MASIFGIYLTMDIIGVIASSFLSPEVFAVLCRQGFANNYAVTLSLGCSAASMPESNAAAAN